MGSPFEVYFRFRVFIQETLWHINLDSSMFPSIFLQLYHCLLWEAPLMFILGSMCFYSCQ